MASFNNRAGTRGHRTGGDRHIICAVDGDGDGLVGIGAEFIGDASGVRLGDALAFYQRLGGWCVVVQRVGPHATACVDSDGAIGGGGATGDRPAAGGAGVDVGGAEGPGNAGGSSQQGSIV